MKVYALSALFMHINKIVERFYFDTINQVVILNLQNL